MHWREPARQAYCSGVKPRLSLPLTSCKLAEAWQRRKQRSAEGERYGTRDFLSTPPPPLCAYKVVQGLLNHRLETVGVSSNAADARGEGEREAISGKAKVPHGPAGNGGEVDGRETHAAQ